MTTSFPAHFVFLINNGFGSQETLGTRLSKWKFLLWLDNTNLFCIHVLSILVRYFFRDRCFGGEILKCSSSGRKQRNVSLFFYHTKLLLLTRPLLELQWSLMKEFFTVRSKETKKMLRNLQQCEIYYQDPALNKCQKHRL